MIPKPHQLTGALFLADRDYAILADEPRVGKTGTAIMAADMRLAQKITVITTASGRAVWRRAFSQWSKINRSVHVVDGVRPPPATADVLIASWAFGASARVRGYLARRHDVLILDEGHYAKSFEAQRTQATFGILRQGGADLDRLGSLCNTADAAWWLTGTPVPGTPADLYPVLRALFPDRLKEGGPDVTRHRDFLDRYTVGRPFKVGRGFGAKTVWLPMGGKNEAELRARLDGIWLRRSQQDVGIGEPIFEMFPLTISAAERKKLDADFDARRLLEAAENDKTRELDDGLASLRRMTGKIKAPLVAAAVAEELECGTDKIVLMAWHTDTITALCDLLHKFGLVRVTGASNSRHRAMAERSFLTDPKVRVFVGQIQAAGEAIDLSSAADLWFVEGSFSPKDMKQAALRITNHTQKRQTRVRMCVLDGTIDEAVQTVLARKWASIREVVK